MQPGAAGEPEDLTQCKASTIWPYSTTNRGKMNSLSRCYKCPSLSEQQLGREHPDTIQSLNIWPYLYHETGQV